jgi:hypothetical protein
LYICIERSGVPGLHGSCCRGRERVNGSFFLKFYEKTAKHQGKTDYLDKMIVVFLRKMLYNIKVSAIIIFSGGSTDL